MKIAMCAFRSIGVIRVIVNSVAISQNLDVLVVSISYSV
jgi:hypothetical protein